MLPMDKKKMEIELMRVTAARMDMEIKIEEIQEEIKRLAGFIEIQVKKENELKRKLEGK